MMLNLNRDSVKEKSMQKPTPVDNNSKRPKAGMR
jgi:hypothetical protein